MRGWRQIGIVLCAFGSTLAHGQGFPNKPVKIVVPVTAGSATHVNGEKFKLAAGIDVVHIPYKGTPEALTDTMAGRVTYFFSPISAALPNVREGKLVALGVSTSKRSSALPNVPTIAEGGLPGFDYNLWIGMFAPAGTPADIVDKINADVTRALQSQEVRERLAALGAEPMVMTPAEFRKFM